MSRRLRVGSSFSMVAAVRGALSTDPNANHRYIDKSKSKKKKKGVHMINICFFLWLRARKPLQNCIVLLLVVIFFFNRREDCLFLQDFSVAYLDYTNKERDCTSYCSGRIAGRRKRHPLICFFWHRLECRKPTPSKRQHRRTDAHRHARSSASITHHKQSAAWHPEILHLA